MQTHAVANLSTVALLGSWAAIKGIRADPRFDQVGAVCIGLAAGAGTVLILLASVGYFGGSFLLPIVQSP